MTREQIDPAEARAEIDANVVSQMILDFYREFRDAYPNDVHTSSLCAVGPLQSMIGLAIKNGHLSALARPASPEVKGEPVAWRCERGRDDWVYYTEYGAAHVHELHAAVIAQPLYASPPADSGGLRAAALAVVAAYDDCTGAEPSQSVLDRAIDVDLRAAIAAAERADKP
jgi:hypothetical protein